MKQKSSNHVCFNVELHQNVPIMKLKKKSNAMFTHIRNIDAFAPTDLIKDTVIH